MNRITSPTRHTARHVRTATILSNIAFTILIGTIILTAAIIGTRRADTYDRRHPAPTAVTSPSRTIQP